MLGSDELILVLFSLTALPNSHAPFLTPEKRQLAVPLDHVSARNPVPETRTRKDYPNRLHTTAPNSPSQPPRSPLGGSVATVPFHFRHSPRAR